MRANWFEVPVSNMPRARQFYETIFELEMGEPFEMNGSMMCFFPYEAEREGATGTLIQHDAYTPSHHGTLIYFSVKEINDVIPRISSAGGKVINEKMSIGEQHGFVGHFEDSEGNRVALHQAPSPN